MARAHIGRKQNERRKHRFTKNSVQDSEYPHMELYLDCSVCCCCVSFCVVLCCFVVFCCFVLCCYVLFCARHMYGGVDTNVDAAPCGAAKQGQILLIVLTCCSSNKFIKNQNTIHHYCATQLKRKFVCLPLRVAPATWNHAVPAARAPCGAGTAGTAVAVAAAAGTDVQKRSAHTFMCAYRYIYVYIFFDCGDE